jgi:hypothetical protein
MGRVILSSDAGVLGPLRPLGLEVGSGETIQNATPCVIGDWGGLDGLDGVDGWDGMDAMDGMDYTNTTKQQQQQQEQQQQQ